MQTEIEKKIEKLADEVIDNYDPRGTFKTWDNKHIATYDVDTVREMLCNFPEKIKHLLKEN